MTLGVIGAVAIAIVGYFSWDAWLEGSPQPGGVVDGIDPAVEVMADAGGPGTDPSLTEPRARSLENGDADARSASPIASAQPFSIEGYDTAAEALESIARRSGMSRSELRQNAIFWKQACSQVRVPSGDFPPSLATEQYRPALQAFEDFCRGIQDYQNFDLYEMEIAEIDAVFDRIEEAMDAPPPESWPEKIDRLGRDAALEEAFESLGVALRALNESKTQSAMMGLIRSELFPQDQETGPRSHWALMDLAFPLTQALMCQRTDGCSGSSHPYVVRYCLLVYQGQRRLCDAPNSMDDAIFQTLTPVEYDNYLRLYSWLSAHLVN